MAKEYPKLVKNFQEELADFAKYGKEAFSNLTDEELSRFRTITLKLDYSLCKELDRRRKEVKPRKGGESGN